MSGHASSRRRGRQQRSQDSSSDAEVHAAAPAGPDDRATGQHASVQHLEAEQDAAAPAGDAGQPDNSDNEEFADANADEQANPEDSPSDDDWEEADADVGQRLSDELLDAEDDEDEDEDDGEEVHSDAEDEQEWEEDDEDDEEEEDGGRYIQNAVLRVLFGRGSRAISERVPPGLQKLPVPIYPLRSDLAAQINAATNAFDVGQHNTIWACLDSGFDSSTAPVLSTEKMRRLLHEQQQAPLPSSAAKRLRTSQSARYSATASSSDEVDAALLRARSESTGTDGMMTRNAARRVASTAAGAGSSSAAGRGTGSSSSSSANSEFATGFTLVNSAQLLLKREVSMGLQQGLSRSQQRHLGCHRSFPLHPQHVRDSMHSRAYIGQYSASGDFFIAAFQDRRVRLYDTQCDWRLRKDVTTRMTRWTITDTCLSPDQRLLVYASISPVAFVVAVGSSGDVVDSQANITELHEPLAVDGSMAPGAGNERHRGGFGDSDEDGEEYGGWRSRDFGIWSIAWSPQGGQLIAGTNDNSVYVYDIESKRCLIRLTGHQNEVNAVAYLDGDGSNSSSGSNPHVLVSGSDDHMVRVWDIRDKAARTMRKPQGVLVGHTEGLTHVCPRGDGLHLISNAKDQTIKLWDVRAALSASQAADAAKLRPKVAHFDYRWEDYPADGYNVVHPQDVSLMTYRGHAVLQTLIRAYFSPAHTTGQRYIYAGSAAGVINAWDVISGKPVAKFEYHRALVRDCSWHPYEPEFTSVSWDGRVVTWGVTPPHGKQLLGDRGDVGRY